MSNTIPETEEDIFPGVNNDAPEGNSAVLDAPSMFMTASPTESSNSDPTSDPTRETNPLAGSTGEAGPTETTGNPAEPTGETEEATVPTEETEPSTEPETQPTEMATQPTEPEVTKPTEVVIQPTESEATQPTEPETQPAASTEPIVQPTEHVHDYQADSIVKPTCFQDGYTVYRCSCGASYNGDVVSAKAHTWTDWTVTNEATSEHDGSEERHCTNCGTAEARKIEKLPAPNTEPPTEPQENFSPTEDSTEPTVDTTFPPVPSEETVPPATTPTHVHSYTDTVVSPSCEEAGYTVHTCDCGSSYVDGEVAALGHEYTETFVVLDPADLAYTLFTCNRCDDEYSDNYISYTVDAVEIQNAIIKYINQFRSEQGSTQLAYLPGMTQVAEYRSVQLTTNFAHDTADMREAAAYYEYGEWVDPADFGVPDGEGYYRTYSQEAIAYGYTGSSADEIGKAFAMGIRNSSNHWRYIGSSEYSFIGVGCTKSEGKWYCCMMVGRVNLG